MWLESFSGLLFAAFYNIDTVLLIFDDEHKWSLVSLLVLH